MNQSLPLAGSLLEGAIGKCCGAPVSAPLDRSEAAELAALLKAVADPARLQLLSIIRVATDCSYCVGDLVEAVGLAQPTVSRPLKGLTDAGLLRRQRRGTQVWFTLVPNASPSWARSSPDRASVRRGPRRAADGAIARLDVPTGQRVRLLRGGQP